MKIKNDFVTNSSSCSYIIEGEVKFNTIDDNTNVICKSGTDITTLDILKMIEGDLQYYWDGEIKQPLSLSFSQRVVEFYGDGWDGGDYSFVGAGWRFFGYSEILEKNITKENCQLTFNENKIEFPIEWVKECWPDPKDDPDLDECL